MNLLIFCHEYPPIGGGASNGLFYLSRAWARAGHHVTVITSGFGNYTPDAVENGVRILRVNVGRRAMDRGRIREMIAFMAVTVFYVGHWRKLCKPDMTLAFMTIPAGPAAWMMKLLYGIPYAVELRGGDVLGFDPPSLGWFHRVTGFWIKRIWKSASFLIANSQGLRAIALGSGPDLQIHVVPNGVDSEAFVPDDRHRASQMIRLIYSGRLMDRQKKVSEIIQALPDIQQAELVIAGDGADRFGLHALAERLEVQDRVIFKGWLDKQSLRTELQSADIFVSLSQWEGMPNAVLEAMACGLPLILTQAAGHDELVSKNENGYLIAPGSRDELLSSLRDLINDPELRMRMGRASRHKIEESYTWERLSKQHLDILMTAYTPKDTSHVPADR